MRHIAWLDDEITTLKPLIELLEESGNYTVHTFSTADNLISYLNEHRDLIDVIILDEHIGNDSGLEIYDKLRSELQIDIPVVFITREEEPAYIKELISRGIRHYIPKPVKFSNLLAIITDLTEGEILRKSFEVSRIPQQFREVSSLIYEASSLKKWREVINRLVKAKQVLDKELFRDLYNLAQRKFFQYFYHNYANFLYGEDSAIVTNFLARYRKYVTSQTLILVVDNLSLWIWEMIKQEISFPNWEVVEDGFLVSLLPSVTQYSRQSLLSGLFPLEIQQINPKYWIDDTGDEIKTKYEPEVIKQGFQILELPEPEVIYYSEDLFISGKTFNKPTVLIIPAFDQLVHLTVEHRNLKEIFSGLEDFALVVKRSFTDGVIRRILNHLSKHFHYLIFCSDHGSTIVEEPVFVQGRHFMPFNPRYKYGEDFRVEDDDLVALFDNPRELKLPIKPQFRIYFAGADRFFVRKHGDYREIIKRFRGSLQHGGISLEEIFVPVVILRRKM